MKRIPAGQFVSWASRSNGVETVKQGVVVGFLPAGQSIRILAPDVVPSRIKVSPSTYESSVDRYVVRCRTTNGLPVIYAPRASVVEAQNGEQP